MASLLVERTEFNESCNKVLLSPKAMSLLLCLFAFLEGTQEEAGPKPKRLSRLGC